MGHSAAARAAMANLTRTLAVEWATDGVRVNAVAPGFVASSGYDTYGGEPFDALLARRAPGWSRVNELVVCDARARLATVAVAVAGDGRATRLRR